MEPIQTQIRLLRNSVLNYPWGSRTAMAGLLGEPNANNQPQAELWMGAHPKAPSQLICGDGLVPLDEAIAQAPQDILGPRVAAVFSNRLPFLFKVLAVAEPLSIQAHPNLEQAREGFERENRAGIPLTAFRRNYQDDNHKPEILCAVTPFWALRGFRRIDSMLPLLQRLAPRGLSGELADLRANPDSEGLKRFFHSLMSSPKNKRRTIVAEAVEAASKAPQTGPVFEWVARLNQLHPGGVGVLCPAILNLVRLQPDEALYLPAGQLHAYLEGVGVEIMANSDNVLRGGLTTKHIDEPELLRVLTFHGADAEILTPTLERNGEKAYPAPAREFRLSIIDLAPGAPYESPSARGVEILLCLRGQAQIIDAHTGESTALPQGHSALVPAAVARYRLQGHARIYKASVPNP